MRVVALLISLSIIAGCATTTTQRPPATTAQKLPEISTPTNESKSDIAAPSKTVSIEQTHSTASRKPTILRWADLSGLRPEYRLLMDTMRLAVCEEPQASELAVPIAPKLLLTTAGCEGDGYQCPLLDEPILIENDEYFCPPIAQGRQLSELSFVSMAPVVELVEWYRNQLGGKFLEYPESDSETIFVLNDSVNTRLSNASSSPTSISIRFSEGIWNDAGYQSEVIVSNSLQ